MKLYAIASGALTTVEATQGPGSGIRFTSPRSLAGQVVEPGGFWHLTPADAWTAEARRLDQQAERAARRARAASIEAEALTWQAGVAMERAREVNRNTGGAT